MPIKRAQEKNFSWARSFKMLTSRVRVLPILQDKGHSGSLMVHVAQWQSGSLEI